MNELQIVNSMLSLIGELPVESLLEDHGYVPSCRDIIAESLRFILTKGWWFNTECGNLPADVDGEVLIPSDALELRIESGYASTYVQRGGRVYDTSKMTYNIGHSVNVEMIRDLTLAELPAVANDAVAAMARRVFAGRHGDKTDSAPLREEQAAVAALVAHDIRQRASHPLQARSARARRSFRRWS